MQTEDGTIANTNKGPSLNINSSTTPPVPAPIPPLKNKRVSTIDKINAVALLICAGFLLFIDLPIVISSPDLSFFYVMMLIVTACLFVFSVVEYFLYRFLRPSSYGFLVALVVIRNCIAVLNVIPFIQLIGLVAIVFILPFVILGELIGWIVLIVKHKKTGTTLT